MKLRWGIWGCGKIAVKFAAGLQASRSGELVAAGGRSMESTAAFARERGIERIYVRMEDLLADPLVDAVYVATPHPEHAHAGILIAEAGKHLLVEKPLALNRADAEAVAFAAQRNGVQLMEAFMYRCHPQTALLVEWIRAGRIGELRALSASFAFRAQYDPQSRLLANALGGGGILDVGCYPVSLARLLAGAALGKPFADPLKVKAVGFLGETKVDEYASALLEFDNGIHAEVSCGMRLQRDNNAILYGTDGRIVIPNPFVPPAEGKPWRVELHQRGKIHVHEAIADDHLYAMEADWFADTLNGVPNPCPGMPVADTLGNMATLDRWRTEIGMVYDEELPSANRPTVDRRPLRRLQPSIALQAPMPCKGPLRSRLVMGVDNQTSYPQAQVIFDEFYRLGGNLFDTSIIYAGGRCEEMLGWWIQNRGLQGDVSIIAKGAHTPTCYPDQIRPQLQQSLNRLRCDCVDLYLLHRDNPAIPVGEFIDALNAEFRAGTVRAFGGSNWSLDRIIAANACANANGLEPMRAISNNFSLAQMVQPVWNGCVAASEPDFLVWLKQHPIHLFAWSSQARGFFTPRADANPNPDAELARCWFSDRNFERRRRAIELATQLGVQPIHIALAYVLAQPFQPFALIGPRSIHELHSSWQAQRLKLSADQCSWLEADCEML